MAQIITLNAPMAVTGTHWGNWGQSVGLLVAPGTTMDVTLSFTPTTALPPGTAGGGSVPLTSFRAEIRYFDGTQFVTENVVFTPQGGDHTITIGEGASTIATRTNTMAGGALAQEIAIGNDRDLDFGFPDSQGIIDFGGEDVFADWFANILDDIGEALNTVGKLPGWVKDSLLDLFDESENQSSPLVIDLDGDGIEVTAFDGATTTTFFDLDSDGFAEQTAWVVADQDGLLARDINSDGIINDASELFGSPTVDGFTILSALDSNSDLVIDANDTAFSELLIWKDINGDAITDAGELQSLSAYNIASIDLAGVTTSTQIINGNPISHTSTITYDDTTTADIVDVWFTHDPANTIYQETYTLDEDTLFLPSLRGFGTLTDLHVSMSSDASLKTLVEELDTATAETMFGAAFDLQGKMEAILYRWAGCRWGRSNEPWSLR